MSDAPSAHASAPTDGTAIEPTLVLTFSGHGNGGTQRRRIPREGLLLGRDEVVFDNAFDDSRMSVRHAEIRLEAGRVLIRDAGSENGTRLNGQILVGERALEPGDVLRLGDTLLVYAPSSPNSGVAEPELVGTSAAMVAVRRSVDAVAARKHMVVVTGETGTGKEVVARLVHQRSGRTGPFVAVNCGTFTEGLLASDLFGHLRGAFTGAVSEQQGLFRAARGGTLLLDEVAEIPLALQANLLRVLEMHEVRPVGGTRDIATDVRVIATSNRELIDLVQAGTFRSDLYSRLAQWTIRLPPLRERREDIPALTSHLLARCDGLGRKLTPDLAEALLVHDWPLNVRGLLTVLSVAVVSTAGDEPLSLGPEVRLALWTTRSMAGGPEKKIQPLILDKAELTRLMERFEGKVASAARHLGITRPKLYRMLWAEEIKPARFRIA
ncbi:MAG: sigma-54-dependent Fis family transcriptional regulator [Deltaproteobacteria bacterium]|nr:MAG: sigma-54-dependent Fis family transcriptional regulator [Deltaproteobacteria bacterium]